MTDLLSVKHQKLIDRYPVFYRQYKGKVSLRVIRLERLHPAHPVGDTVNVGIYTDCWNIQPQAQYEIGRFQAHPGQGKQLFPVSGNGSCEIIKNNFTYPFNIPGFHLVKTGGIDEFCYLLFRQGL